MLQVYDRVLSSRSVATLLVTMHVVVILEVKRQECILVEVIREQETQLFYTMVVHGLLVLQFH